MRRFILLTAGALIVLAYFGWQSEPGSETSTVNPEPAGRAPAAEARVPVAEIDRAAEDSPSAEDFSGEDGKPADAQAHEILADIRNAWECYKAPNCSLGEDQDPRAEYFEAGERIATGMRALIEQHRTYRIDDVELANAAHEVLKYDSGRARAAAIEALDEIPPADEHLDALVTTLDQHHDEKLFELALPQLQHYAAEGHRDEVDAFLQSNLRSGAHFPARTIARELEPFLTPDNVARYRELAKALPRDSRRAALMETLEAYEDTR